MKTLLFELLFLFHIANAVDRGLTLEHDEKGHRLTRLPVGLFYASNRGYPRTWSSPWGNSISTILQGWLRNSTELHQRFHEKANTSAFTYIDTFGGQYLALDDAPPEITDIYKVVSRPYTNYVCDKLMFAEAAKKKGLDGVVVPRTFETKEEAIKALANGDIDVIFIKDPLGTKGEGIEVVGVEDLPSMNLPFRHLIQEGLTKDLELHDGKKVTFRMYFIIMRGAIYCHLSAGWVQVQDRPFNATSTDEDIQVSHHDSQLYHLDKYPNYEYWVNGFVEMGKKAGPIFDTVVFATEKNPLEFSFLGVDVIPFKDGSVKMIEVNSYPSFRRPDVMAEIILWMFGLEDYDDDLNSRWAKVWERPQRSNTRMTQEEL